MPPLCRGRNQRAERLSTWLEVTQLFSSRDRTVSGSLLLDPMSLNTIPQWEIMGITGLNATRVMVCGSVVKATV